MIIVLISLLSLYVAGTLYLDPGSVIQGADFSIPGVSLMVQMWAARQAAIGVVLLAGALLVPGLLRGTIAVYVLMNLQDIVIGYRLDDTGLAAGAAFFAALGMVLFLSSGGRD